MIAGIETGGTKVLCAVASAEHPDEIITETRIATTTPVETLGAVSGFLREACGGRALRAVGIASFGPLELDRSSPDYGRLTATPKRGWEHASLLEHLALPAGIPFEIVTDVTGAAIGEQRWGAARGLQRLAYATIGTGVGVGLILDGAPLVGTGYPEMGHILVRRHPADRFEGVCRYHGDCLEGLASGPAVSARWGADASSLPPEQQVEAIEILAYYIAQLAAVITAAIGTERIVLGGGVMQTPGLPAAVREQFQTITGGADAGQLHDPESYLVLPGLDGASGLRGALALAQDLLAGA